jgi:hypothetical protein
MSLRRALGALPDDRDTASAVRLVVAFLQRHPDELVDAERISRATGVARPRVLAVMQALSDAFVVDCGGSGESTWRFTPNTVSTLEVQRFLRSTSNAETKLQKGAERFRSRFGPSR